MSFTAGAVFIAGGTLGYVKARSIPSLVAGLGLGTLMVMSGIAIQKGQDRNGHVLGFATSLMAFSVMGARAARTGKMMPAGAIASVGGISALYHGKKTYEWA